MTLQAALLATRRRMLRPEGYGEVSGAIVAFLILALAARFGANLYRAQILANQSAYLGQFFTLANIAWCALFLACVAPLVSYRGIARTARSSRLSFFPVGRRRLLGAVIAASLRGVPVFAPVGLAVFAWFLSIGRGSGVLEPVIVLCFGLAGFLLVLATSWWRKAREDRLELIEVAVLGALILANPEFRIVSGTAELVIFFYWTVTGGQFGVFWLFPILGAAAVAAAVLVSSAASSVAGMGSKNRRRTVPRRPGLVLYRVRIPRGLFVASYAVEIPVILSNPNLATVRTIVLLLFGVRILWFLAFVFRNEQAFGRIIRAPARQLDRMSVYLPAAGMHALLCAAPPILFLFRIVLG